MIFRTLILMSILSLTSGRFNSIHQPSTNSPLTLPSSNSGPSKLGRNIPVPLYRYFDGNTGDHFYTTDVTDIQDKPSYTFDRVIGKIYKDSQSGTVPLFRYFNPQTFHHSYTISWTEFGGKDDSFKYQGITGYVFEKPEDDALPLYRYHNNGNGDYFYSTDLTDLKIPGYDLEAISAYIYPETYIQFSIDVESLITDEVVEVKWNSLEEKMATGVEEMVTKNLAVLLANYTSLLESFEKLHQNPVPIGFLYIQLPNQFEPSLLWPLVTWSEVTEYYAGLFFRVLGGNSADFGSTQLDNAPRVTHAETKDSVNSFPGKINLPIGGTSEFLYSSQFGTRPRFEGTRYTTSGGEVRPINQAVKLWRRSA